MFPVKIIFLKFLVPRINMKTASVDKLKDLVISWDQLNKVDEINLCHDHSYIS